MSGLDLIFFFGFLVGAFRRKTQTIVVTFFKTNEVRNFISFISWLHLTATLIKVVHRNQFFEVCQAERPGFESRPRPKFYLCMLFRFCETFFANFFNVSRGPPSFFSVLQKNWMLQKTPKAPFFSIFLALCDLPETSKQKFEKKNRKQNFGIFFSIFPHAGSVEENT